MAWRLLSSLEHAWVHRACTERAAADCKAWCSASKARGTTRRPLTSAVVRGVSVETKAVHIVLCRRVRELLDHVAERAVARAAHGCELSIAAGQPQVETGHTRGREEAGERVEATCVRRRHPICIGMGGAGEAATPYCTYLPAPGLLGSRLPPTYLPQPPRPYPTLPPACPKQIQQRQQSTAAAGGLRLKVQSALNTSSPGFTRLHPAPPSSTRLHYGTRSKPPGPPPFYPLRPSIFLARNQWTGSQCSAWASPTRLRCGRRVGVIAAPSVVQLRRAVDRSLIFHAVGALENMCACASGAARSEGTRRASGSKIPDHATIP